MSTLPNFVTEANRHISDNTITPLGRVDLTASITQHLSLTPKAAEQWLAGKGVLVHHINNDLPPEIRPIAWRGELQLPNWGKDLAAFMAAIGGVDGIKRFQTALNEVRDAKRRLEDAEKQLEMVRNGRWETELAKFEFFYFPGLLNEYVSEPQDAYDDWRWDEYVKRDPHPRGLDFMDPQYKAWDERYAQWVRKDAPPFCFGTNPFAWDGLTAKDIREAAAEDEDFDVEDLIDCSLQLHHEDANEQVVDMDGLYAIVEKWLPFAGTGKPEDLALEAAVAAWNEKQTIVSYWPDMSIVLPAFDDADHAEAIAWCEQQVSAARDRLNVLENGWEPAAPRVTDERADGEAITNAPR